MYNFAFGQSSNVKSWIMIMVFLPLTLTQNYVVEKIFQVNFK